MFSFFKKLRGKDNPDELTAEKLLLKALEDVDPVLQDDGGIYLSSVKNKVVGSLKAAKASGQLHETLRGTTPEGRVLYMIAGTCLDELSTGRYHVYRGVLSGEGGVVKSIYLRAVEQLEKRGVFPSEEARESRKTVEEIIKETG